MVSLIDFSKPVYGTPTTQSVRDNFQIAQTEITNLQQFIANGPFLPLDGGTMTGKLELWRHPVSNLEAATKQYVDDIAFAGGGMPDAPRNGFYYVRGGGETSQATENEWIIDPIFNSLKLWDANKALMFGMSYDATYNYYDLMNASGCHFRFNRLTKLLELVINSAVNAGFSDSAITLNRHIVSSAGLDFNNSIGGTNVDLSKHINLYGGTFGINYTGNRLNFIASGMHVFVAAGVDSVVINTAGLYMSANTNITLAADPTTALHASTKQYVDATITRGGGPFLPTAGGTLSGGLSLGSAGVGVPTDLSRHLSLWGTIMGFGITGGRLNYVVGSNNAHIFIVNGIDKFAVGEIDVSSSVPFRLPSDPTTAMQAATKQYVDAKVGGTGYLPTTGGTINGNLRILSTDGGTALFLGGTTKGIRFNPTPTEFVIEGVDNTGVVSYQPLSIGGSSVSFHAPVVFYNSVAIATGQPLTLGQEPTTAAHAVTKTYVDTKAGQYLPLIGGTVTGPTTFNQSLNVGTGTSNATVIAVNAASTTAPGFAFYINGSQRWLFAMDHWPETGGATGVGGAGFVLHSYTNNGGYRGEIMGFARDTGMMILSMATLRVARDPTTGLEVATKQYVDVSATNSGINSSYNVGRNLIHNPLFNIAQRGAGPFTMAGYTLDRWLLSLTGDAANVSAGSVSDAVRTQIGDEAATNYLLTTFTGTAGAAAVTAMLQPIEGVQRISGKTVTVSFFAWASTALKLGVSLDQNFGSGGSPSASVNGAGVAVTLSSTASRYSVTLAVPSTIGKTLGTQGGDKTFLLFWFSSGANNATRAGNVGVQSGSIAIWGVQLEIGSVRTPLEKPDPRYDLSNCQRFYATGNVSLYAYNTAGSYVTQMVSLPVPMRASPTIVPTLIPTNLNTLSMDMQSNYQPRVVGVVTATGNCSVLGTFTASADL